MVYMGFHLRLILNPPKKPETDRQTDGRTAKKRKRCEIKILLQNIEFGGGGGRDILKGKCFNLGLGAFAGCCRKTDHPRLPLPSFLPHTHHISNLNPHPCRSRSFVDLSWGFWERGGMLGGMDVGMSLIFPPGAVQRVWLGISMRP